MQKRSRLSTVLLILTFFAGLGLLLYPTVSDRWNRQHSTQAITVYEQSLQDAGDDTRAQLLQEAEAYNLALQQTGIRWSFTEEQHAQYESALDLSGDGMFGYIEIEKIDCRLPVYHGTGEAVLLAGAGHLEGSSLPIGGEGTHCMISGHRGLPSARLFTDLDQLVVGDRFVLRTMDLVLTYEVDRIRVVLPNEVDELCIYPGEDYCTLITCTPYGINSHRLLVRGRRVENDDESRVVRVTGDALQIDPLVVAPIAAAPVLVAIFTIMLLTDAGRKRRRRKTEAEKQDET